ncbi:MAG: HPF/RaiA family ribosome-associated protein [Candidatus Krumholzibacteriota bacterium]
MQLEINARHFTMGDDQREMIEAAVEKLVRFSPRPVESMKMTITHEAGRFFADSVLYLKSHEFRAKAEGMEPEYAVNEMNENLRKQLAKFKGKISGKQKGEGGGLGKAMLADAGLPEPGAGSPEGLVLLDMDVAGAQAKFAGDELPFLVFRNVDNDRLGVIYRRSDGELGHMEYTNG